ncbi:phosphate ABC transporter permease PstA [Xanthomonadaceae bacterium JHOS43]|nr:phosphate ABC transporter permease PstA [Xanthomonadaceae bacterium JHOS43]MCX7563283.1 phosphate ABC transporter permease PstA [Xanthomonadaceae bacterium XH05]
MQPLTASPARQLRRRATNLAAMALSFLATVFGLAFLAWIVWTTLSRGMAALNLDLFTQMTPPPNEAGGLLNAFFGSAVISAMAIGIGTPVGIAAGLWLAEYARATRLGATVRFVNDILLSAPSIVLGLFIYALVVLPMGHFSAFAGAIALALVALPVIVRTTDEMLALVPTQMREAALSLGIPQWKVTMQILFRAARPGIVTGILLALARISGETAPLLFTAYNNQFWSTNLMEPMANVPMVIYQYALSPFASWNALAWAGALIVMLFVLTLSLVARAILLRHRMPAHD